MLNNKYESRSTANRAILYRRRYNYLRVSILITPTIFTRMHNTFKTYYSNSTSDNNFILIRTHSPGFVLINFHIGSHRSIFKRYLLLPIGGSIIVVRHTTSKFLRLDHC